MSRRQGTTLFDKIKKCTDGNNGELLTRRMFTSAPYKALIDPEETSLNKQAYLFK